MAPTNGYCTTQDVKARMGIAAVNQTKDTTLDAIITAVSRQIDNYCQRRFWTANETRVYTPTRMDRCLIDDCLAITSLKTDVSGLRLYDTTWTTTDYDLLPYNAPLDFNEPYWMLVVRINSNYVFPVGIPGSVQVIGTFGYATTTPDVVREAAIIQAIRLLRRMDAPFGVVGTPEFGQAHVITTLDPDVRALLSPLRRLVVG